jgi:o-succinylbenzoate synthase
LSPHPETRIRLDAARLLAYRLALREPWVWHGGRRETREGWLVELSTEDGRLGHGDCAPLPELGSEPAEHAHQWLVAALPGLRGRAPAVALAGLPGRAPPAARFALETALLDLTAQLAGLPLRRLLEPAAAARVAVNAAAGALDEAALGRCLEAVGMGFSVLKLKLALASPARELAQLHLLAAALPVGTRLRLDANRGWTTAEAQTMVAATRAIPVESLEEPLARPTLAELHALQRQASYPLAVDESLPALVPAAVIARQPVSRLVLKPALLGGLRPTLASVVESIVGVTATAQLAAAVDRGRQRLAHGLATSRWLLRDLAPALPCTAGVLSLPAAPGLGLGALELSA